MFETGYGYIHSLKPQIQVCEGGKPIFMIATPVSYALKEQCRARASVTGAKRDDLHSELNWLGCPSGVGPQERWFTESVLQLQLDSKQVH